MYIIYLLIKFDNTVLYRFFFLFSASWRLDSSVEIVWLPVHRSDRCFLLTRKNSNTPRRFCSYLLGTASQISIGGDAKKKVVNRVFFFFPFILSFYRLSRNASRNFMVKSTRRTNKNGEFLCGRVNTFVEENIGPAAHRRVRESRDTYLSYRRIQRANPLPRGKTSEKEKRTRISVLPEFATRFFSSREYRHGKKKKRGRDNFGRDTRFFRLHARIHRAPIHRSIYISR